MSFQIRSAQLEDLSALVALDAECFPLGNADLEPAAAGEIEAGIKEAATFVAVVAAGVVGMLQINRVGSNEWELLTLAITESERARGIGQALMERLLEEMNKSPYLVSVSALTSPNNLGMQGLLESFGFIQVGLLADHFGPGRHRLKFQLN